MDLGAPTCVSKRYGRGCALDSELSFYAQIFGFELPADEGIEPVEIEWGTSAE